MSKVKSITPLPPADFTPNLGNYKTLQPFRYWCQKVLPLVYDDSLSYYELLCKVVDYLNKTMEDVETLHGDVTNLHMAYEELQGYVNGYFSTLDVQKEINNKLDEMAKNGTLSALMQPYLQNIKNELTDLQSQVNSLVLNAGNPQNVSAEIAQARNGYATLNARISADIQPAKTTIEDVGFDLNNAEINRIYAIGVKCLNSPVSHGTLVTFSNSLTYGKIIGQLIFSSNGLWSRFLSNSNVWSEWDAGLKNVQPAKNTINDTNFDLNNAEINRIYGIGVKSLNSPVSHGTLVTFSNSLTYGKIIGQLIFSSNGLWSRFLSNSNVWSDWINSYAEINYPILNAFSNLIFFGDSLTASSVVTGSSTSRPAFKTYPQILSYLCGAECFVYATGGENANELWNRYNEYIKNKENSLAIIFIGTNDGLTDTLYTDCPTDTPWTEWISTSNTCAYAKFIMKNKSVGNAVLLITCNDSSGDLNITNKVIRECAKRFGCGLINNIKFTDRGLHTANGHYDSVHYNDLGYAKMSSFLYNSDIEMVEYLAH